MPGRAAAARLLPQRLEPRGERLVGRGRGERELPRALRLLHGRRDRLVRRAPRRRRGRVVHGRAHEGVREGDPAAGPSARAARGPRPPPGRARPRRAPAARPRPPCSSAAPAGSGSAATRAAYARWRRSPTGSGSGSRARPARCAALSSAGASTSARGLPPTAPDERLRHRRGEAALAREAQRVLARQLAEGERRHARPVVGRDRAATTPRRRRSRAGARAARGRRRRSRDDGSSHWTSSTSTSERRGARPAARRRRAAARPGRARRRGRRPGGRSSSSSPANGSSISVSTPVARSSGRSRGAAAASSALLPTPGAPSIRSAPPRPARDAVDQRGAAGPARRRGRRVFGDRVGRHRLDPTAGDPWFHGCAGDKSGRDVRSYAHAQRDLLDGSVAGRLHRRPRRRVRLVGPGRRAAPVPQRADARARRASLRPAAVRDDGLLGAPRPQPRRHRARVRPLLAEPAEDRVLQHARCGRGQRSAGPGDPAEELAGLEATSPSAVPGLPRPSSSAASSTSSGCSSTR